MLISLQNKEFKVSPGKNGAFWREVAKGTWESDTFAIFDRFLDRQHSYIDIGAWIGPTLLYGCQLAKSAYAVEPDPLAFAELEQNIDLNRPTTDNIRVLNICIAPKSGEVAFGSRGQGGDSTSSLLFGKKKTHWTVKGLSFDDFIRESNITECNFIKMDIEGGEYAILPTMVDYLKLNRPTLHLSLHPCYLKLRPLGWIGRVIARVAGTRKIIRCTAFYKHIYDHNGRVLTAWRLLWLCRAKITMDIVLTDSEWSTPAPQFRS
ncbi:MAG: FkbM family methyltransferase [Steroidobacterales bacterium]